MNSILNLYQTKVNLNNCILFFSFFKQFSIIDYANFLLKNNVLWSPSEYLDHYFRPFNVTLESGNKIIIF